MRKTVLVTGGSVGIGAAVARLAAQTVAADVTIAGGRYVTYQCNVADPA